MKNFIGYLKDYFRQVPRSIFAITLFFTAALVLLNYTVGIENRIRNLSPWPWSLFVFFGFYLLVFGGAYWLQPVKISSIPGKKTFIGLMALAAFLFALKIIPWDWSFLTGPGKDHPWSRYTQILLQLPVKLLVIAAVLYVCHKEQEPADSFYGFTTRNFSPAPYLGLLLIMVPLIAIASTRPDFLHAYPKMKTVRFMDAVTRPSWPWKLLYEISYGLDFVSIELFFRGFLVLGLVRFAGPHVILPMAVFYCTIHFGKPLGECISSFFGGLILGVIALRTRTIFGGLIVHLGIAWLMELGAILGRL